MEGDREQRHEEGEQDEQSEIHLHELQHCRFKDHGSKSREKQNPDHDESDIGREHCDHFRSPVPTTPAYISRSSCRDLTFAFTSRLDTWNLIVLSERFSSLAISLFPKFLITPSRTTISRRVKFIGFANSMRGFRMAVITSSGIVITTPSRPRVT